MPPKKNELDRQRTSLRPAPQVVEKDFADWVYKPHTVAIGCCLTAVVVLVWWFVPRDDVQHNVKRGIAAASFAFCVFGAVHFPDSLIIRPHPAVWRAVLAAALLYLVSVVFFLFQDLDTVRAIFTFYDASLAQPLPERSYATDCRMSTEEEPHKFYHTVADVFLVAHLGGYWMKTLVLRDWRIVTAVSLGFEILEVTFQHVLPNFAECWWDHILVDVLICNGGGTLLGVLTLRAVNAKEYNWVRLDEIRSVPGKAKRVLGQLAPRDGLIGYKWNMFDSPKRFCQVLLVLGVMLLQELNAFASKAILNMTPTYHLVPLRLLLWAMIAIPGTREFYDFISEPSTKRLGTTAWVGAITLAFETLWLIQMAVEGGYFREPCPLNVLIPWIYVAVVAVVWCTLYFGWARERKRNPLLRFGLNVLFYSMPLALGAMFVMTNRDLEWGKREFLSLFVR
jgi:phosphatidylserine synthase 2